MRTGNLQTPPEVEVQQLRTVAHNRLEAVVGDGTAISQVQIL